MSELGKREDQDSLGVPMYLDDRDPELDDPAVDASPRHWKPACPLTSKLARCVEALRDTRVALRRLSRQVLPLTSDRSSRSWFR